MDRSRPPRAHIYLAVPLLLVLFFFESQLSLTAAAHQALQLAIVFAVFGLIYLIVSGERLRCCENQ